MCRHTGGGLLHWCGVDEVSTRSTGVAPAGGDAWCAEACCRRVPGRRGRVGVGGQTSGSGECIHAEGVRAWWVPTPLCVLVVFSVSTACVWFEIRENAQELVWEKTLVSSDYLPPPVTLPHALRPCLWLAEQQHPGEAGPWIQQDRPRRRHSLRRNAQGM